MKPQRIVIRPAVIILLGRRGLSHDWKIEKSWPSSEPVEAFLGRWDLTLKGADREYPSWLNFARKVGG